MRWYANNASRAAERCCFQYHNEMPMTNDARPEILRQSLNDSYMMTSSFQIYLFFLFAYNGQTESFRK